jgi:hypothetical protein
MILACKLDGCAAAVLPFVLLTRLRFGLSAEELRVLGSCLSPVVQEGLEVSEVQRSAAAVFLLIAKASYLSLSSVGRMRCILPGHLANLQWLMHLCQPGTC